MSSLGRFSLPTTPTSHNELPEPLPPFSSAGSSITSVSSTGASWRASRTRCDRERDKDSPSSLALAHAIRTEYLSLAAVVRSYAGVEARLDRATITRARIERMAAASESLPDLCDAASQAVLREALDKCDANAARFSDEACRVMRAKVRMRHLEHNYLLSDIADFAPSAPPQLNAMHDRRGAIIALNDQIHGSMSEQAAVLDKLHRISEFVADITSHLQGLVRDHSAAAPTTTAETDEDDAMLKSARSAAFSRSSFLPFSSPPNTQPAFGSYGDLRDRDRTRILPVPAGLGGGAAPGARRPFSPASPQSPARFSRDRFSSSPNANANLRAVRSNSRRQMLAGAQRSVSMSDHHTHTTPPSGPYWSGEVNSQTGSPRVIRRPSLPTAYESVDDRADYASMGVLGYDVAERKAEFGAETGVGVPDRSASPSSKDSGSPRMLLDDRLLPHGPWLADANVDVFDVESFMTDKSSPMSSRAIVGAQEKPEVTHEKTKLSSPSYAPFMTRVRGSISITRALSRLSLARVRVPVIVKRMWLETNDLYCEMVVQAKHLISEQVLSVESAAVGILGPWNTRRRGESSERRLARQLATVGGAAKAIEGAVALQERLLDAIRHDYYEQRDALRTADENLASLHVRLLRKIGTMSSSGSLY